MKALLLALVTVAMLTLTSTTFAGHPQRCLTFQRQVQFGHYRSPAYLYYNGHSWGVGSGRTVPGFEYKLGFDERESVDEASDSIREIHGIQVVVDKKSSLYLDGTEIDYHSGIEKRGFVFNNSNATRTCGCGSSFQA